MTLRYHTDDEWVTVPATGLRIVCCDCGATHDVEARVAEDGALQFKAKRNHKSTGLSRAAIRRRQEAK